MKWLALLTILGSGMTFERYLAQQRPNPVRFVEASRNPYADTLAQQLDKHLKTVRTWLNGTLQSDKMREAMRFFTETFPGHYTAKEGRILYRGQNSQVTDGSPRSYSYDQFIADSFACEPGGGPFAKIFASHTVSFRIQRKVCHRCADAAAFRYSLDLAKVLSDYGLGHHKYAVESEVVIFNTKPKGQTAQMFEITCERSES